VRIRAIRDPFSFCPFEHSGLDIVSDSCPPLFWRIVLCISNFFFSISSASPCGRSTFVETPLQIALFSAKQSQCQNGQYKHKYSKNKGLCQRTTNNQQRTLLKTNPIKANFKRTNTLPRLPDETLPLPWGAKLSESELDTRCPMHNGVKVGGPK